MRSALFTVLVLVAPVVRAQNQADMEAAREALESARSHLEQADHEYAGHRAKALERVNQALEQVKLGLGAEGGKEKRIERREGNIEEKDQRIDQKLDQIRKRQQQMELR